MFYLLEMDLFEMLEFMWDSWFVRILKTLTKDVLRSLDNGKITKHGVGYMISSSSNPRWYLNFIFYSMLIDVASGSYWYQVPCDLLSVWAVGMLCFLYGIFDLKICDTRKVTSNSCHRRSASFFKLKASPWKIHLYERALAVLIVL